MLSEIKVRWDQFRSIDQILSYINMVILVFLVTDPYRTYHYLYSQYLLHDNKINKVNIFFNMYYITMALYIKLIENIYINIYSIIEVILESIPTYEQNHVN